MSDRVPWYRNEEKRERVRREMEDRYEKVHSFRRNRMIPEVEKMQEHMAEIGKIYREKVIPYENEDDSYRNKASQLYCKYTDKLEMFMDYLDHAFKRQWDMCAGILNAVKDFFVGIGMLALGLLKIRVAWIACVSNPFAPPDWAINTFKKTDDTIAALVYDPALIIEGICQNASDTVEEKGIVYAGGYIAGDIMIDIFITKGLDKLRAIKAAKLSDEAVEAGSLVDEIAKVDELNPGVVDDIIEGTGKRYSFASDADGHFNNIDGFDKKHTGIKGAHNIQSFVEFERPIKVIGDVRYSDIDGIFEVDYTVAKMNRGKPDGWLDKIYTKTLFDPDYISSSDLRIWAEEAFDGVTAVPAKQNQLYIKGTAKNGLKFEGWLDGATQEITSYYPVLDWTHPN